MKCSINRRSCIYAYLGILFVLSGCGNSEPTELDIKTVFDKQQAAEAKALGFSQQNFNIKIISIKKIGCKEVGKNDYKCDLEIKVSVLGTEKSGPVSMRFIKSSDGWAAINN